MSATDSTDDVMTRAEATELAKVVRMQARVANRRIDELKAERLAEMEATLAAEFQHSDERWSDLTREASQLVKALDAELAERCEALGLRPEFRPALTLGWYKRGQNGDAERRAELRKVGQTRIEADARAARTKVEQWQAGACAELVARHITSADARRFLSAMPIAEELVKAPAVAELEAIYNPGGAA